MLHEHLREFENERWELLSSRVVRLAGGAGFTLAAGSSSGMVKAVRVALISLLAAQLCSVASSRLIQRRRPVTSTRSGRESAHSFPSTHAASAFAIAGGVGSLAPRLRAPLFVGGSLVSLSRLWLGEHYPSDVVGGAVIGFSVGCMTAALDSRWEMAPDFELGESSGMTGTNEGLTKRPRAVRTRDEK